MGAPRKAHSLQSVKIRSTQRLTTNVEPNIAWQEVTNVVKPMNGTYQAATQVKVLSPENNQRRRGRRASFHGRQHEE